MDRRTMLRRLGATAGAGITASGLAAGASGSPDVGVTREMDVSDLSGAVRLDSLVENPETAFELNGHDPSDVRLVVPADQTTVGSTGVRCGTGCCCDPACCPDDCEACWCRDCDTVRQG